VSALLPTRALRDAAGQWWATDFGAYLVPITDDDASGYGHAVNDAGAVIDAALAKATSGVPVDLALWKPAVEIPAMFGWIEVTADPAPLVILERSDGQLVAVDSRYFDGICDAAPADFGYGLTAEQCGDQQSMIRFVVGETVVGYLMPIRKPTMAEVTA
jgi:hypothetical protein